MTHVFISYVRENKDVVDRLAAELSKRGAAVWLDRTAIAPGARWKDEIRKAIRSGDFFLACFSREYDQRQKTHMNEELVLAIDALREMPADRTWFIPVLINGGRIPERRISSVEDLSDLNAVDLSGDWDEGIEKILKSMGLGDPLLGRALFLAGVARNFKTPESLHAIEQIGQLGVAEKRVLGVLIEATTSRSDHDTKHAAVQALIKIGASAVPALAAALGPAEEVSRKCILHALKDIGPDAAAAVPEIVKILEEEDFHAAPERGAWFTTVPERAIRALAHIGADAAGAVPCLSALLTDSHERIRVLAAFALTRIGAASAPALVQALAQPELRKNVAAGILMAGRTRLDWRGAPDWTGVRAIIQQIGMSVALPGLLATLDGNNESLAGPDAAIGLLTDMASDAAPALPFLRELRERSEDEERKARLDRALTAIARAASPEPSLPQRRRRSAVRRRGRSDQRS